MPKYDVGTKLGPRQAVWGSQNTAVGKGLIYLTNLIWVSIIPSFQRQENDLQVIRALSGIS